MIIVDFTGQRAVNTDHIVGLEVTMGGWKEGEEPTYYVLARLTNKLSIPIYEGTKDDCISKLHKLSELTTRGET